MNIISHTSKFTQPALFALGNAVLAVGSLIRIALNPSDFDTLTPA